MRYFNVAGPTFENLFRQNFNGYKHLLKKLSDLRFSKKVNYFKINGKDYDTYDGTCVRDFIHVQDIAKINYKAINKADKILKKKNLKYLTAEHQLKKLF